MSRFIKQSMRPLTAETYTHAARKLREFAEIIESECVSERDKHRRKRAIRELLGFAEWFFRKHMTQQTTDQQSP